MPQSDVSHLLFDFRFRKPRNQDIMTFSPLSSFSMTVWFAVILLALITSCVITSFSIASIHRAYSYPANFLDTLFLFTGQASLSKHSTGYLRISVGPWALGAMMISGLFSGTILIALVKSNIRPPFSSLKDISDCIQAKRCTLAVNSLASVQHDLLKANPLFETALKNNPPIVVSKPVSKKIFDTKHPNYYLFLVSYILAQSNIAEDTEHHVSDYFFFPYDHPDVWGCPVRKGSPLRKILFDAYRSARMHGLVTAAYQKYLPRVSNRITSEGLKVAKPLSINEISGTMVLLASGCAFAATVLAAELIFRHLAGNNSLLRAGEMKSDRSGKNLCSKIANIGYQMDLLKSDLQILPCHSFDESLDMLRSKLLDMLNIIDVKCDRATAEMEREWQHKMEEYL